MPLSESDFTEEVDRRVVQEAIKFVNLLEAAGYTFDPKRQVPIGDTPGEFIDALEVNFKNDITLQTYYISISFCLEDDLELFVRDNYDESMGCYFNWFYWIATGEFYDITPDFDYSELINKIIEHPEPEGEELEAAQKKSDKLWNEKRYGNKI